MRRALVKRGPGYIPSESELEREWEALLESAGERIPRRQVDVGGEHWIGRVDYRDEGSPVIWEIDGRTHHQQLLDAARDACNCAVELTAAGLVPVTFTTDQIRGPDLITPAPARRTSASARSATTRSARARDRPPAAAVRESLASAGCASAAPARHAGARPKRSVVTTATAAVNLRTRRSIATCSRPRKGHRRDDASARTTRAPAGGRQAPPPPSSRLSVSSCRTIRPRPAPSARAARTRAAP